MSSLSTFHIDLESTKEDTWWCVTYVFSRVIAETWIAVQIAVDAAFEE